MADRITPGAHDVLLVADVQNDFIPGGALPVADGAAVVPVIVRLAPAFPHVVLTQDWHPPGHVSFASSHPGRAPSRRSGWTTASRFSGPITACRPRPAPTSTATCESRTPR